MTTPQAHYDRLLAKHYSWMFGVPFEQKVREQAELLSRLGIGEPGVSVDLGCGSGFQAIALADLGAERVHAIDTSGALLAELRDHAADRPIVTYERDLLSFAEVLDGYADMIVCMGDTLTHLASKSDASALFANIASCLSDGGRLVLTWRDLSSPPAGLNRFIPLRSTDDKMMVCFLEDQGETVMVHDLVHVRGEAGWQFERSAYPKLKLSPAWVRDQLVAVDLSVAHEETLHGLSVIVATR